MVARAAVVAGQGATDGITVAPTVEFVDAIVQGTLNATSSRFGDTSCSGSQSSSCLTYEFVSKDGFGKLDLDTVPAGPLTDPQSFTVLPYLTWDLDTGAGKGTQTFQVRVTEVTDFDAFVTGLPLIGLLAGPLIGLLQQAPLVGSLLAPVIGASTVAEISVDMATLAPGATPAAFTYKVPSFDGVLISTNFFPAADIQPGIQSPLVLNGPGLGAAGVTNPYRIRGTEQFVPGPLVLRDANYNLITWDPRGEFASEGVLQLDNPFYEGRDASAIISWAAQNPLVQLDSLGDPAVGMVGGSYGGAIQWVTAATDPRVDAIVPGISWNSLISSLYPTDVFKSAWATVFSLSLLTTGARVNSQIYPAALSGLLFGVISESAQAVLGSSGPTSLLNVLRAPAFVIQSTVDTLFPLAESVSNVETLTANPFGTPVKMAWYCGSHGYCRDPLDPTMNAQLFQDSIAWLDTYVADIGDPAADIPVFQWWDQKGTQYTSELLPTQPGFNQSDPYTTAGAAGMLPIIPVIGGSGPLQGEDLPPFVTTFPYNGTFGTPAANAINMAVTPPVGAQIVGAPQLSFSYQGIGNGKAVFAQLIDNATGRVVGNNVTPIPVTLDGQSNTVTVSMQDIAYTVGANDSLTLQILAYASLFANSSIGAVNISDVQLDLPLRNQSSASYTVTTEVTAAVQPPTTLDVEGWQGLTTAGTPGQYLISGTTPNPDGSGSTAGLLYQGPITAEGGAGYVMVMPDQPGQTTKSTTTYSADVLGGGQLRVVGTYTNESAPNEFGYVFTGTLDDVGDPANYVSMPFPTPTATWNTPHSTANGLVVGNYDSSTVDDEPAGAGRAYIYDAVSQTYLVPDMIYPDSVANTNYGIWWNGGTSYTIAGGYSNLPVNNLLDPRVPLSEAMIVDYDSATGEFSNWTSYRFTDPSTGFSGLTHFEGISGVGPGRYTMASTALDEGQFVAGFVTVERNPDGSFGEFTWTTLSPPVVDGITFADSVYGNAVVGIAPTSTAINAYQAVITPA